MTMLKQQHLPSDELREVTLAAEGNGKFVNLEDFLDRLLGLFVDSIGIIVVVMSDLNYIL